MTKSYRRTPIPPFRLLSLLPLVLSTPPLAAQQLLPRPADVLGFEPGTDSMLADWGQINGYLSALATASPYIRLDTIGATTLGRPLLLLTAAAPSHQSRLGALKAAQRRLADPRQLSPAAEDSLARTQPAVVFINNNIHSTEIASSLFGLELAYRLANEPRYRAMLEDVVVLMTPSANPDGMDTVVAWYRAHKGTPYEGGPLPWLYHPYIGHDNNRDWYMLTQVETQAITRVLYEEWFPEVVWDVHQMGNRGARLFVPPFSDPVNPNLDPIVVQGINLAGTAMAAAVLDAGRRGVVHGERYDLWWHGGFRTVPARHNMIGILSEAASARLASPLRQAADSLRQPDRGVLYPAPWPGGTWGIGDIIEYELLAADGLLRLVAADREAFIRRFVTAGRRAVAAGNAGDPFAYLIPPDQRDPAVAALLANLLMDGGVEVFRAGAPFTADGARYPLGTLVVPMAQPFRSHAKDLLEPQRYPDRRAYPGGPPLPPYDVTGWTLPLQMGVDARPVVRPFTFDGVKLDEASVPPGRVSGAGPLRLLANRTNQESRTIAAALALGARAVVPDRPVAVGTSALDGGVVLEHPSDPEALARLVSDHAIRYGFDAWAVAGPAPTGPVVERLPRIGLYRPWTASMDEGWTRWVFEQHGIPYVAVTDSTIRAGDLDRVLDVLVLPDVSPRSILRGRSEEEIPARYAGGIGAGGAEAITAFVRDGGVLVALDASSSFAISNLNLPVRNVIEDTDPCAEGSHFCAPGSIFGVALRGGSPLTSGLGDSVAVFFSNGKAFEVDAPAQVVARYAEQPLRSGYALEAERIAGAGALVEVPAGGGRVVLFGFRPQHRGQTHATFKLLFNAVLLDTAP